MTLERHRRERLVILNPSTSAYDAARAMQDNHVGCVVVQGERRVVGIVTDRDLVMRVIAGELEPTETSLEEVMTPDPVTVAIDDSERHALELMREHGIRRLPLMEGKAAIGLVTLDDLLLSGTADPQLVAEVVHAQLAQPARFKPAGATHPQRVARSSERVAQADRVLNDFATHLQELVGLENRERALTAFSVVASGIVRRLTAPEAHDFISQLPKRLRDKLLDLPAGPDREVTRASIEREMAGRLDLDPESAAALVERIGGSLQELVSAGELQHLKSQLPDKMKAILEPPGRRGP